MIKLNFFEKYRQDFVEYGRMDNDFIDDDKIWNQLNKWENPKQADVRKVLKKAEQKNRLEPEETAILIQNQDKQTIQEMYALANKLLLNKFVGKQLQYDFKMGHDFPENIDEYDMVIHCGSCMLNKKVMQTRIDICVEKGIKITNYGVILAYLNGILDRCMEIFE